MQHLFKYLHQAYPYPDKTWRTIVIVSLLVFALLYIFQPFGIQNITAEHKLLVLSGYAAVTAVTMCLHYYVLPILFPRFYNERHWTVAKHILSNITLLCLIALGNVVYSYNFNIVGGGFTVSLLVWALGVTVAVGIFPITVVTILQQNKLLATSLCEASQINVSLSVHERKPTSAESALLASAENLPALKLVGSGKDDRLEIDANMLIYMEAIGNYIKVNYMKNGVAVQKMLRATVKQMEDTTAEYPFISKCHRAFIVNLNSVKRVSGNSQGYRLTLNGAEDEIPVARAFTHTVKSKIEQLQG